MGIGSVRASAVQVPGPRLGTRMPSTRSATVVLPAGAAAPAPVSGVDAPPGTLRVTGGRVLRGSVEVQGCADVADTFAAAAAALQRRITLERVPTCSGLGRTLGFLSRHGWRITCAADRRIIEPAGSLGPTRADPFAAGSGAAPYLACALLAVHGQAVMPPAALPDADFDRCVQVFLRFGDEVTVNSWGYLVHATGVPASVEIAQPGRCCRAATVTALIRAASTGTGLRLERPDTSPETRALVDVLGTTGSTATLTEQELRLVASAPPTGVARPWRVPGDRFEAALYIGALAATGGCGTVAGIEVSGISDLAVLLRHLGVSLRQAGSGMAYVSHPASSAGGAPGGFGLRVTVGADGGAGDLDPRYIPALAAVMLTHPGRHLVVQRRGDSGLAALAVLFAEFGARASYNPGVGASLTGTGALRAARYEAGGACTATAAVLAALAARRTSVINGADHLLCRHPRAGENLAALGARLEPG